MNKGNPLKIDERNGLLSIRCDAENRTKSYAIGVLLLIVSILLAFTNMGYLFPMFMGGMACMLLIPEDKIEKLNIKVNHVSLHAWYNTENFKQRVLCNVLLSDLKRIYISNNILKGVKKDGQEFTIMSNVNRRVLTEVEATLTIHLKSKKKELERIDKVVVEPQFKTSNLQSNLWYEAIVESPKKEDTPAKDYGSRNQNTQLAYATLSPIFFAKISDRIPFQNQELQIVYTVQTDWKNGTMDKHLQAVGLDKTVRLFHLEQDKAIINAYQEESLKLYQLEQRQFSVRDAPNQLTLEDETYFLVKHNIGNRFINEEKISYTEEQWIYRTDDNQKQIRVVKNDNLFSYYKGEKLAVRDFYDKSQETLNLDENPAKLKLTNRQKLIRKNRAGE